MEKSKANRGRSKLLAGCFLILAYGIVQGVWAADPDPAVKTKPAAKVLKAKASSSEGSTEAQFVGADTCITCHQDNGDNLLHSAHGRLMETRKGVPFQKSCETCHGPGSLHVEGADDTTSDKFKTIKFPPKLKAPEANAICLTCHEAKAHFHWKGSPHDMRDVTCVSCHNVHQDLNKPNAHLLKTAKLADTCFTCHLEKKAQFARNAHMPLHEGDMTCTSCHDMHGTSSFKNLRGDSVNETCYKCHADKRGPFLNEHPPTRESCVSCHNPHGSNFGKMLVEKSPFLCQRCHTPGSGHPATAYDDLTLGARNNKILAKGCLNCHSQIHGSNHPSGRYFQR